MLVVYWLTLCIADGQWGKCSGLSAGYHRATQTVSTSVLSRGKRLLLDQFTNRLYVFFIYHVVNFYKFVAINTISVEKFLVNFTSLSKFFLMYIQCQASKKQQSLSCDNLNLSVHLRQALTNCVSALLRQLFRVYWLTYEVVEQKQHLLAHLPLLVN